MFAKYADYRLVLHREECIISAESFTCSRSMAWPGVLWPGVLTPTALPVLRSKQQDNIWYIAVKLGRFKECQSGNSCRIGHCKHPWTFLYFKYSASDVIALFLYSSLV